MNPNLLPELIEYIFALCSSKDRSILCQVSKAWHTMALLTSKRLSSLSYDDKYTNKQLYGSGDYHLIVRLKRKCANMQYICSGNNIDVVELMIDIRQVKSLAFSTHTFWSDDDWNDGLYTSCKVGSYQLVNLTISHGANNWNSGLYAACKGGHLELAKLMISLGADNWNWGLYGACEGGHLELAKLMISHGANNWNDGLYNACRGGHLELTNLMISYGANNWDWGLYNACIGGHLELAKLMISHGARKCVKCVKQWMSI
jgi:hypothetical protein